MNIAIPPGMNVLAACEALTALDVFGSADGHEILVGRLEDYVRAQSTDITTKKGQDDIRSLAAKVARTKTGLDDLGKEFVADLKKQTGAVHAKRKLIRDRLDVLRDEVRAPLTAFEEAEEKRIAGHEAALVLLAGAAVFAVQPSVAEIDDRLTKLKPLATLNWEEFGDRATEIYDEADNKLNAMRLVAVQAERDAAELAELRQMKASRDAQDLADQQAREVAENQRLKAEKASADEAALAERDRLAAIARDEKAERDRIAAAEQAEQDAISRANAAIETERKRVAKVAADADAVRQKLERNKWHRVKIHADIVEALAKNTAAHMVDIKLIVEALAAGNNIPHVTINY